MKFAVMMMPAGVVTIKPKTVLLFLVWIRLMQFEVVNIKVGGAKGVFYILYDII